MLDLETTIGFATSDDAIEIGNLSRTDIEYGLGWKYTPERVRALARNATKNVVAARRGSVLVGFGVMTYGEEIANLDLLGVKAGHRHRGVGRQIVAWLEAVARTAGISAIHVQVRTTNRGAIRFYERLGFQAVEELAGYYHGKESATLMSRGLRALVTGP